MNDRGLIARGRARAQASHSERIGVTGTHRVTDLSDPGLRVTGAPGLVGATSLIALGRASEHRMTGCAAPFTRESGSGEVSHGCSGAAQVRNLRDPRRQ